MSVDVETIVAISIMMAVFSAVAAIGSSLVLGAGFERLRAGMDVIKKQTGFFSDAIHRLEEKMEVVDKQTGQVSRSIEVIETKVQNVGEQANAFTKSVQNLERKVEIVDQQAGFFGDAIHKLENKVEKVSQHEDVISERLEANADAEVISVEKTEALVSHAEQLLSQMGALADKMSSDKESSDIPMHEQSYDQSFAQYSQIH